MADRSSYDEWINQSKKSVIDRAAERMDKIPSTQKPLPITAEQDEDIDRILEDAVTTTPRGPNSGIGCCGVNAI